MFIEYNGWTLTHQKIFFQYLNPTAETIDIEDIAHALSQICRFTGHTSKFYSVAQHSVMVSRYVSEKNRLWALLHDAPEAYINDLASPLKRIIKGKYATIEKTIMEGICKKFGLPPREPDEVKFWDRALTVNELWSLIDPEYKEEGIPVLFHLLPTWSSRVAKREFLAAFKDYSREG